MNSVQPLDSWANGRVVLGTASLGMAYGRNRGGEVMSEARAFEILDAAWELGIRSFDTAEVYGEAPGRLRHWLGIRGRLGHAHIVTKVKLDQPNLQKRFEQAVDMFAGSASVTLLSHNQVNSPAWTQLQAVRGNREVELGQSVYTADDVAAALRLSGVSLLQVPGNVFDRAAVDARGSADVRLDIRSVFLQGVLLDAPSVAEARVEGSGALAEVVQSGAREVGHHPAPLLIAAVLSRCKRGDRVVLGADTPQDLLVISEVFELGSTTVHAFIQYVESHAPMMHSRRILDPRLWTSPGLGAAGRAR